MKLESKEVLVNAERDELRSFVKNPENIIHLLPQDAISDWQADSEKCSFKVQGGVVITLVAAGDNGSDEVYMKSGEKSPFDFNLVIHLDEAGAGQTKGHISFDGKVNMFLKMMVEKPLSNLFNYMSEKMQERYA